MSDKETEKLFDKALKATRQGKDKNVTYTLHAHMVSRDGSKNSFWTRTGLTKRAAQKLASEQRKEPGGVARIVPEKSVHGYTPKGPWIELGEFVLMPSRRAGEKGAFNAKVRIDKSGYIPDVYVFLNRKYKGPLYDDDETINQVMAFLKRKGYKGPKFERAELGMQGDKFIVLEPPRAFNKFAEKQGFKLLDPRARAHGYTRKRLKVGSRVEFSTETGTIRGVVHSTPYRRNSEVVIDVKPTAEMDLRFSPRFMRVPAKGGTIAVPLKKLDGEKR